jgi:hypothetical protein
MTLKQLAYRLRVNVENARKMLQNKVIDAYKVKAVGGWPRWEIDEKALEKFLKERENESC